MKGVLVTGSEGFIGKNLCTVLRAHDDIRIFEHDLDSMPKDLSQALEEVDYIIHLAGVNRPQKVEEFDKGNAGSLEALCHKLKELGRSPKIILSSSIQAELDNPYGVSKRRAEEILRKFSEDSGAECVVFRFKNLFGKWCRPNYNSVTATFCHNIANDLPIQISDPSHVIELTYIDDVIKNLIAEIDRKQPGFRFAPPLPSTRITLGQLADKIRIFRESRTTLKLPDFSNAFERALYATYLSYLSTDDFGYGLQKKSDQRGALAEFLKSPSMGQIFISRTHPGITRGEHYHHTKTEKFMVIQGEAVVRFRHIDEGNIIEHRVSGQDFRVLDIPPGYTHNITNVGKDELVTLFWASEIFDLEAPDTFFEPVCKD